MFEVNNLSTCENFVLLINGAQLCTLVKHFQQRFCFNVKRSLLNYKAIRIFREKYHRNFVFVLELRELASNLTSNPNSCLFFSKNSEKGQKVEQVMGTSNKF